MVKMDKNNHLQVIKNLIQAFGEQHLNEELTGYALNLCERLGRMKRIDITRGQKEVWAAAIIHAIARINFLYDKANALYMKMETVCDFFAAKKTTVGNKASEIMRICRLGYGSPGYCSLDLVERFTFVQTPEGFVIPLRMLKEGALVDLSESVVEREERLAAEQKQREIEAAERRQITAEKKRQALAAKRRENLKDQLGLFEPADTESPED